MKKYSNGKRIFKGVTLAAMMCASVGLQANDPQDVQSKRQAGTEQHVDKQMTAEKFIQKASMSGQLEVQAGQLAQKQAQNQQVKQLAQSIVQDHQSANQKLMQIAKTKNVQVERQLDQKHRQKLDQLQGKSGAEFDKQFVKQTIQHHKKDIQSFEKASQQLTDSPELRSFAQQTLPVLKKHLEMAQNAARTVGLDEATIAADIDVEEPGVGAPAAGVRGETFDPQDRQQRDQQDNRQFDTETKTQPENKPRTSVEQGRDFSASANLSADEEQNRLAANNQVNLNGDDEIDQEGDREVFQEGDGRILGLPTSNNDGTILGLFPAPSREIEAGSTEAYTSAELADGQVDPDVDSIRDAEQGTVAVGGPATSQSERATDQTESADNQAPEQVREALRNQGWNESEGELEKMTVYKTEINGREVLVDENGEILTPNSSRQ